ncbi:MAG: aminotransferase class I/II-fold pyridoxal phosphate-dependent enzyme [Microthrixaceae bacterium]|nr:aminotransferase class I/II-fold pyridoxal phosphate-dependent enzyme [Microthrixaceae bacterium]
MTRPGQDTPGGEGTAPEQGRLPTSIETDLITIGRRHNGASLAPVVNASSTFGLSSVEEGRRMALSSQATAFYSRYGNPTVNDFEEAVADLERAEAARAFGSGMGAIAAAVLGLCSNGDHIVAQKQLYAGTQMLLNSVCPRMGIEVTFVDGTDPGAWAEAVIPGRTMVLLAETPANPRLDLVDLRALGEVKGPMKVVDSTFATPLAQRPLELGCDLVIHSVTKFLGGHNDVTLGVAAGARDLIDWLWGFAVLQGAVASPHEAAAATRGLRTLGVRLRRQSESAARIAAALEEDPRVESVRYPGLPSHPQHDLAVRQMALMGGLVTFDVVGGLEAGSSLVEATRICRLATSLGGPETLVTHPASTTHVSLLPEELAAAGIGAGTIRMSVGLEDPEDLLADLDAALGTAP